MNNNKTNWGAYEAEWKKFVDMELVEDMLPVVSNPGAGISPNSSMKQLGKTPSLYNKDDFAVGISKWTEKKTTIKEIGAWSKQTDYGICIQTREVRALDIDVSDKAQAAKIQSFINDFLEMKLPVRFRGNSGKCLLAFRLPGELKKRVSKVDGGIIEFLATGQQFIAAGQHTSGARYEWDWNGHDNFPVLDKKIFENLWFALCAEFGIAPSIQRRVRSRGESKIIDDPTLNFLEEKGLVLDYGSEGQAFIGCPFCDEHTMESSESATAYFSAGTGGYQQGHFKCLHAHCEGRTDMDFVKKLGIIDAEISNITDTVTKRFYINATIQQLARLDSIDYEMIREKESKRLGFRVGVLDERVLAEKEKGRRSEEDPEGIVEEEVKPWDSMVSGKELYDEIHHIISRHIICDLQTKIAATLWIVFTWFIDHVNVAPLALISAPEKRCGKTQLLTLIGKLCYKPLISSNISPAAVYRVIEAEKPTLLIDEADAFLDDDNDVLRGILNSGHTRDSAYVIRTVGEDHEPQRFCTWGAKAIAGIGKRAGTLLDRSITLELRRKLPTESIERLRYADKEIFDTIKRKLLRFLEDNKDVVRTARPKLPENLNDREQDNWEPLFALAALGGDRWLENARYASEKISKADMGSSSNSLELLSDIRKVFVESGNRLHTADLISSLNEDTERPWYTFNRGKPLDARRLAKMLGDFNIKSKDIKVMGENKKGYDKKDFEDSFIRYLPGIDSVSDELPEAETQTATVACNADGSATDNNEATSGHDDIC